MSDSKRPSLFQRLKIRWGIRSNFALVLILLAFALAGSSVLVVTDYLLGWVGLKDKLPLYLDIVIWIFLIFPIYQVLLLFFGLVLGQFTFFWDREKELWRMMQKLFRW